MKAAIVFLLLLGAIVLAIGYQKYWIAWWLFGLECGFIIAINLLYSRVMKKRLDSDTWHEIMKEIF